MPQFAGENRSMHPSYGEPIGGPGANVATSGGREQEQAYNSFREPIGGPRANVATVGGREQEHASKLWRTHKRTGGLMCHSWRERTGACILAMENP